MSEENVNETPAVVEKSAEFSFKVPKGHPDEGTKITKSFGYREIVKDHPKAEETARAIMSEKKWTLAELVNENLKAAARSNAYQTATLPYKATEIPEEDIVERMVRDYIRLGFTEEIARQTVTNMLAARKAQAESAEEDSE